MIHLQIKIQVVQYQLQIKTNNLHKPPTSNVPDNALNVLAAASSSNTAMSQVPPLQIRPSDYTPLHPPMVTKFGSLAIGRCKGCWEKIDHRNVGPGTDMAMRLRLHKIRKNPRTGNYCQSPIQCILPYESGTS